MKKTVLQSGWNRLSVQEQTTVPGRVTVVGQINVLDVGSCEDHI